jgi:hypothetical protein
MALITRTIHQFLERPLIMEDSRTERWATVLVTGVFVAVFLNVFQPFTIYNPNGDMRFILITSGYGVVGSILIYINEFPLRSRLRSFFDPGQWTIGRQLIWFTWQLLVVSFGIYAYRKYWCCGWESILNLEGYGIMLFRTYIVGFFPILGMLAWQYHRSVRKVLDSRQVQHPTQPSIHLVSEYRNEELFLDPQQLLAMESADNYILVFYHQENTIMKKMIRSSLRKVEQQLTDFPNIIRCHRSVIVNLEHVQHLEGNSRKMELHLRHLDWPLPVSRKYIPRLKRSLSSHSSLNMAGTP